MLDTSALDWNHRIGTLLNLWPVTPDDRWRPVGGWRASDPSWRAGWPAFWLEPLLRSAERRYIGLSLSHPAPYAVWEAGEASAVRTVGDAERVGVGSILLWGALAAYADWRVWRESWSEIRPGLVSLDRAVGGRGLDALDRLIADPDVAATFESHGADPRRTSEVFVRMAELVDPDAHHIAYRQLVHAGMTSEPLPPPPAEGHGPWARGAALLYFAAAVRARTVPSATTEAWSVLRLGGGTDFQLLRQVHHLALHPDNGPRALRAAARAVVDADGGADAGDHPLRTRLRSVAEMGRYDGSAHLAAARELGERGRPGEALPLLADAAICAAPLGAPVLGDVFRLAASLGRELGLDGLAERAARFAADVR